LQERFDTLSRWGPVIGYAGFIFYLSSRSSLPGNIGLFPDKLGHAILYSVLGVLLSRALTKPGGLSKITRGLLAVLLATAYGVSDELHQSFVPHRTMDIADVAADFVGAAIGAAAYLVIVNRFANTTTHIGR
jgi:VanZ family protein